MNNRPLASPARIVLFGEGLSMTVSPWLVRAALEAAKARGDVEIVAAVDTSATRLSPLQLQLGWLCKAVSLPPPGTEIFRSVVTRHGVRLLDPPGRNVNNRGFVRMLAEQIQPDYAIALGCSQIFHAPLLKTFKATVNYHNGLLPAYAGVVATRWSVYGGEAETGFTYHYMNEKIDDGPILIQGSMPIGADVTVETLELEKTRQAAMVLDELFDVMLSGAPGRPQAGERRYFSRRELRNMREVGDPCGLTWHELQRRLRAFKWLWLLLQGHVYEVTEVKRVGLRPRHRKLAFQTHDGVLVEPVRFSDLPLAVYRCREALLRLVQ